MEDPDPDLQTLTNYSWSDSNITTFITIKVKGGPFEAVKHNFGFHFWFNYILLCEQLSGFSRQVARARVSKPVRLKPQICINAVAMLTFAVFILFGLTTPEDF